MELYIDQKLGNLCVSRYHPYAAAQKPLMQTA